MEEILKNKSIISGMGKYVGVIVLVSFVFSSLTISAVVPVAADADELDWTGPNIHFEQSEKAALDRLVQYGESDKPIHSDWHIYRQLRVTGYDRHSTEVNRKSINNHEQINELDGYIFLRQKSLDSSGLMLGQRGYRYKLDESEPIMGQISNKSKIISTKDTNVYI